MQLKPQFSSHEHVNSPNKKPSIPVRLYLYASGKSTKKMGTKNSIMKL